jgi:transcriptional regulator with XRE-family HTH domain
VTIAERILEIRKQKLGLTQREFANVLDVDPMRVSKWERGVATPRLKTLRQIAKLGDVPVSSFFADEVAA